MNTYKWQMVTTLTKRFKNIYDSLGSSLGIGGKPPVNTIIASGPNRTGGIKSPGGSGGGSIGIGGNFYDNNLTAANTNTSLPKEIQEYLAGFRDVKFFDGGSEKVWREVKKITRDWIKVALAKGVIHKKPNIKRMAKDFIDSGHFYKVQSLRLATKYGDNFDSFRAITGLSQSIPSLVGIARRVMDDVVAEKRLGKNGLACHEAEVLRRGGTILGLYPNESSLAVYFPFAHETIMEKLLGGGNLGVFDNITPSGSGVNVTTFS